MGEKLTAEQVEFLRAIQKGADHAGYCPLRHLPCVYSRQQDRDRQALRKAGFVLFTTGRGWCVTEAGRAALATHEDRT